MKLLVPVLLAIAVLGVMALPAERRRVREPGPTVAPLLSCPNVDASADNKVDGLATFWRRAGVLQGLAGDELRALLVRSEQIRTTQQAGPRYTGGKVRVDDILAVVSKYFTDLPRCRYASREGDALGAGHRPVTPNGNAAGTRMIENASALAALGISASPR